MEVEFVKTALGSGWPPVRTEWFVGLLKGCLLGGFVCFVLTVFSCKLYYTLAKSILQERKKSLHLLG